MKSCPTTWPSPTRQIYQGRHVTLSPLRADDDVEDLFQAGHDSPQALELWRYLWQGPFADATAMHAWLRSVQDAADPMFFTVTGQQARRRVGMISIMRITPQHGCAELGHIWYGVSAQRTPVNTESVFLLLQHLFDDLSYRRVEWKCDAENVHSRAAALRLGFAPEGIFRQHMVVKGRSRDTAWFAMLDGDWPRRKANFEQWLSSDGKSSLSALNQTQPPA